MRAAATLAGRYLERRDRVGLVTFGGILRWLEPGGGLVQRYRLIDALLETGVEFSYAWKDVNIIPRADAAAEGTRDRGHAAARRALDRGAARPSRPWPRPGDRRGLARGLVEPGDGLDALAYRLWLLRRAALRARFERSGVAVARWSDDVPLDAGLEGVRAFRRRERLSEH